MIHVIPESDLQKHTKESTCKCEPAVIVEDGELIIIHNSFERKPNQKP